MFYDIYLYTLCYYICCLLGACMRCTRLCSLKPGVTPAVSILRWRSDPYQVTVPWQNPIQCTWQSKFRAKFLSDFYSNVTNTLQQNYSLIDQLQLWYIVHPQTVTGSCSELSLKLMLVHCQSENSDLNSLTARFWAWLSPDFSQEHGLHS
jgi:hypothetical protein